MACLFISWPCTFEAFLEDWNHVQHEMGTYWTWSCTNRWKYLDWAIIRPESTGDSLLKCESQKVWSLSLMPLFSFPESSFTLNALLWTILIVREVRQTDIHPFATPVETLVEFFWPLSANQEPCSFQWTLPLKHRLMIQNNNKQTVSSVFLKTLKVITLDSCFYTKLTHTSNSAQRLCFHLSKT